ncbi:arginine--tRNA ligase [Candidatus Saccharibacteria bacterium]|nr:arginine--tRNA ligase [Candidatus Saccharibacteria bacterium]
MQEVVLSIEKAIKYLFDLEVAVELTLTDEQFGDYATNIAMRLSKKLGQNPREIAQQIVEQLKDDKIERAEIAGPGFINITVKSGALAMMLNQEINKSPHDEYGASEIGSGRTVVCEFPSPNMAKPFSVGHIRSALQGWAIYKLMRLHGYSVITDNHLGDSGTPFGKWVVGFQRYSSDDKLDQGGINELARVYIVITAEMKEENSAGKSTIADEVQQWLQRLEAQDPEAIKFSERFNKISLDHMHKVMARLNIQTELELGESFYVTRGQEMVDELIEKGVAKSSEGAVIVELDELGINTPVMLRKANGTALYATTDLATIEYREKHWSPERVFIHTGEEQNFYFRQLNGLSQKAGFKPVIQHLWHGLVDQKVEDGGREKMSSRKGVVLLQDLLDYAEEEARKHNKDGSDESIKAVALGAIKFADFTADRKNGVLFDWENMFSVQGFSGPAVQYSAVRINSILDKAGVVDSVNFSTYDWKDEKRLLVQVLHYPILLRELHDSYEMHKLSGYLYDLARSFNRYYEEHRIITAPEPEKSAKLWTITQVRMVLVHGLDILGIPTPEKM